MWLAFFYLFIYFYWSRYHIENYQLINIWTQRHSMSIKQCHTILSPVLIMLSLNFNLFTEREKKAKTKCRIDIPRIIIFSLWSSRSFSHYLMMIGDAVHNNFHVIIFLSPLLWLQSWVFFLYDYFCFSSIDSITHNIKRECRTITDVKKIDDDRRNQITHSQCKIKRMWKMRAFKDDDDE